ncbi:MAG: dihydrolipoyl dehydrogenase [Actinobacteria bacterium]|nr:dihydrolipoyl dehydrogenase [Actinomycetota bacterium]
MPDQFDVVVLGGGPGGYAAALYGAAAGLRIALVEEQRVGGTCLHHGCIPAKELLQTAEVLRTVQTAKEFGVNAGEPTLDVRTSQARKHQVIDRLTKGLETLLKGREVTVISGTGAIADAAARRILVSEGTEVAGNALVLATGSAARSLPGLDFDGSLILSSDHVLELEEVPRRVAIIGAGAVGCEFASMLADFGTEVTLLEALPRILPGVDAEVSVALARAFRRRNISAHAGVRVTSIEGTRELAVTFEGPEGTATVAVDQVVVCVGRAPRTQGLGLEESGVGLERNGFVQVNDHMQTTVPGVYAVGDVVDTPALAHVAFAEAIVAVKTILGEEVQPIQYDKVPWGIYCHPEVAFSGLTEEQARERGYDVVTAVQRFVGDGRALILGEPDGIVKIVAERDGPILGVHMVGPWATELIAEGYLAVNWEASAAEIAPLIHAHPTLSEVFGEATLALTGRPLH